MKKILILTAFALGSLATAQTTTPAPVPAPVTPAPVMPAPVTPVPDPAAPAPVAPPEATPPAPMDMTTPPAPAADPAAPAPMDMTTPPAPTDPAATPVPAQSTTTTTTTEITPPAAAPAMTPEASFARAQELATQADVAYPIPFYDRTLWKAAVDAAYMASSAEMGNRDYTAYLGQLYTKTQWWINAYNVWTKLGELTEAEKDWASLSAAKLAFIALNRGDRAAAQTYVNAGMAWKSTPSLMSIAARLR